MSNIDWGNSERGPLAGATLNKSIRKKAPRPKKVKSGETRIFRFLAILLGIGAVLSYVAVSSDASSTYVIVATSDIPGQSMASDAEYSVVVMDTAYIEQDTFTGNSEEEVMALVSSEFSGQIYAQRVLKGQQIRRAMFSEFKGLSTPLGPDERLVAINAQAVRAVAATVKAGDKVDVYVSRADGLTALLGQGIEIVTVTIDGSQFESIAAEQLNNPDLKLSDFIAANPVGGTYVIRIPAADVSKYVASNIAGVITLSIRGDDGSAILPVATDLYGVICPLEATPQCERSK